MFAVFADTPVVSFASVAFLTLQCVAQVVDPTSGLGNIDIRGNVPNSSGGCKRPVSSNAKNEVIA